MVSLHMRSPGVVVFHELRDKVVEVPLSEDYELGQALQFYGLDESLAPAVHLRRQLHRIATMRVELSE